MIEMQRIRITKKAMKRAERISLVKIKTLRIKKKCEKFWIKTPQKSCGVYSYYYDKNGNWCCHFISNRQKRFGVVHNRAVKLSRF